MPSNHNCLGLVSQQNKYYSFLTHCFSMIWTFCTARDLLRWFVLRRVSLMNFFARMLMGNLFRQNFERALARSWEWNPFIFLERANTQNCSNLCLTSKITKWKSALAVIQFTKWNVRTSPVPVIIVNMSRYFLLQNHNRRFSIFKMSIKLDN